MWQELENGTCTLCADACSDDLMPAIIPVSVSGTQFPASCVLFPVFLGGSKKSAFFQALRFKLVENCKCQVFAVALECVLVDEGSGGRGGGRVGGGGVRGRWVDELIRCACVCVCVHACVCVSVMLLLSSLLNLPLQSLFIYIYEVPSYKRLRTANKPQKKKRKKERKENQPNKKQKIRWTKTVEIGNFCNLQSDGLSLFRNHVQPSALTYRAVFDPYKQYLHPSKNFAISCSRRKPVRYLQMICAVILI